MSESPDPDPGAPRWPADRRISPTTLKNYRNCPYRVRLADIDHIPAPPAYHVHLRKGLIAHDILRDLAHLLKQDRPVIDQEEILRRARLRLPPQVFPSAAEREAHASDIVRWVVYGKRYIERIPDATWLLIERNQSRTWPIFPGRKRYTIIARPDVVLQRTDAHGQPFIEIIDYKTGQVRPEDDPPVLMRFVFRDLLACAMGGDASSAPVRFTWLWLDAAEKTQIDLTVEHCNDHWSGIARLLESLASETVWKATPSFLCHYCPYYRTVCTEEIPPGDRGGT